MAAFFRNKGAAVGAVIVLALVVVALLAHEIVPHDPLSPSPQSLDPPSRAHPMGTDLLGRDVLSRVMVGARLSLLIGLLTVCLGATVGSMVGLIAGYFSRLIDAVVSRITDGMLAFPGILLALSIVVALGSNLRNVVIAVGIATAPSYVRLTRGNVLSVKEMPYVDAARTIGCSNRRIMFRHILPNVVSSIIVFSTIQFGIAILSAASLSFLGLGAQPPQPEWGLMVSSGRQYLGKAWWMSTFPGLAITTAVVAINLVGDGLREALDPRLRRRG